MNIQPTPRTGFLKIRQAADIIRVGGIVAYPTEAVYGLGCDPHNPDAVRKILTLKRRRESAGLILIAADLRQLDDWIEPSDTEAQRLAGNEDGVTWVVTASQSTPDWVSGGRSTVAVRITQHPVAAALCRTADMPIISTSANRSGRRPAHSALAVRRTFGADIDYVLTGSTDQRKRPSEIRNAQTGEVLRPG